jgi:hypothetical protein
MCRYIDMSARMYYGAPGYFQVSSDIDPISPDIDMSARLYYGAPGYD